MKKFMLATVAAIAALIDPVLLSAGALAQVPEATGPYRVSNIKSACSTSIKPGGSGGSGRAGMEGVCFGAISTVMRFGPAMNDRARFCPPATATPKEAIPIVLKFVEDNPQAEKLDIRDVANYVGRQTWPCQ